MAEHSDPHCLENAVIDGRFNPEHPLISRIHANVNLDLGEDRYTFRNWNPRFGDVTRYSLCKWVGRGRYSDVFISLQDGERRCAIKLLKPTHPIRVRRELKILSVLQTHPNILELWDVVIDGRQGIPAMVTQAIDNQPFRKLFENFDPSDIKFYVYRLLTALAHTHRNGVIHRDVKQLNILCDNPRKNVVLADWGLAEFYHPVSKYSLHVSTQYFKSPELLLGYQFYDYSLDIWSAGVVFFEALVLKFHVFDSSTNDGMITEIARFVGGQAMIDWGIKYRCRLSSRKCDRLVRIPKAPQTLETVIPEKRAQFRDPLALDLLLKMLNVDHKERITADEALLHPYFNEVVESDRQAMDGIL
jgi:casein kinase II subunit alpha